MSSLVLKRVFAYAEGKEQTATNGPEDHVYESMIYCDRKRTLFETAAKSGIRIGRSEALK